MLPLMQTGLWSGRIAGSVATPAVVSQSRPTQDPLAAAPRLQQDPGAGDQWHGHGR